MKRVKKGEAGYIRYQQIIKLMITVLMFALPVGLFVIGLVVTKTRLNWFTFIAILGCLPACKSTVGVIMFFLQKPADAAVLAAAAKAEGELVSAKELVFTTYEHTVPVNTLIVCGNQVVGYTPDPKTNLSHIEKHLTKVLAVDGFTSVDVKIFKDLKQYCQRVSQIRGHQEKYREGISFVPDERYPEWNREQLILHTLIVVAL